MKLEILATKKIERKTWYLCRGNLKEYLDNLKADFHEFAIQRRIVKNQYLDTLFSTIKSGDPIPMITLTYNNPVLEAGEGNVAQIDMGLVEILDGLQRTFRLWAYKIVADNYKGENGDQATEFAKRIKNTNELFFDTGVISTNLVRSLISSGDILQIHTLFESFEVYFFVWAGLNEREIIQKMLVLNAGQKAVSKTHQFELLFLHFYNDIISKQKKVVLRREKDKNANEVKRGKRQIGEFMFSTVIVSLQSFVEMKPLRVATEDLIGADGEEETSYTIYQNVFSKEFISEYLSKLYSLDQAVDERDSERGKEWFVKDTTLSGVFAALGKYINVNENWSKEELSEFAIKGFDKLRNKILEEGFNLKEFTNEYNILSSRSVNIGNFIRRVVMDYTLELLLGRKPIWKTIFDKAKDRK